MSKRGILRVAADGYVMFWCPGCDGAHGLQIGIGSGPRWGFNDNYEKPTFSPSILVRGTDFTEEGRLMWQEDCRARDAGENPPSRKYPSQDNVCHSFVNDGMIQFLSDCTHKLANQTVPLLDFDTDIEIS